MAVQYSGVHIVNSTTPQEAHDLALITHLASRILKTPFVHFFDAKSTARTAVTVNVLLPDQIRQLADAIFSEVKDEEPLKPTTKRVTKVIDSVMSHAAKALGKRYPSLISYYLHCFEW